MVLTEPNRFGLPQGDDIRRELVRVFRGQKQAVLDSLKRPGKAARKALVEGIDPREWVPPDLFLGTLPMSERFTPMIRAYWERSGEETYTRVGLDPDAWEVVNPALEGQIRGQAFDFCQATNATTADEIATAHANLRSALEQGLIAHGEAYPALVKRVTAIFRAAETWRARRIAQSEASRAVHAAQIAAAEASGVVAGVEWLLSSDACPICKDIARDVNRVRLGDTFAVVGDHPTYSTVRHPPAHPHCQCSLIEVLKPEYGGPEPPEWGEPIDQPGHAEADAEQPELVEA